MVPLRRHRTMTPAQAVLLNTTTNGGARTRREDGSSTTKVGLVSTVTKSSGFHVVLIEPEIPSNTGAIARLCVATGSMLHLVGRLGFQLNDRKLKRAGLDYWNHAHVVEHLDLDDCRKSLAESGVPPEAWFYLSAHAEKSYTEASFPASAALVFGSETRGLPPSSLAKHEQCWRIPIFDSRVRSLNLATAVGIVLYEAIRQQTVSLE